MEKQVLMPGVVVYKNAIPKEWNLIERYEASLNREGSPFKWHGAEVGYGDRIESHRNCQDFKYKFEELGEMNEYSQDLGDMHKLISNSIWDCLADYGRTYNVNVSYMEAINVVKYGPGEYFNHHSDDGEAYRCTVSTVAYINDDYEGGELDFLFFDLKWKPEAGDMIVFPSSYIYSHASLPVRNGIKYSLVTMTDRNEFAHYDQSPIYHPVETRKQRGML